jgi:hypothetical protein
MEEAVELPSSKPAGITPGIKPCQERDAKGRVRRKTVATSGSPEQQLADMEWVYGHHEGDDTTEGQKTMRAFKERSPGKFLDRLARLQRDLGASKRGPEGVPEPTDPATEKINALLRDPFQ